MLSPQMPVSCIFCPGEGGAFKQTTNSRWAHLLCANWIPEVGVANTVYMEPIDNIDKIPASRWKLTCYICKMRMGACIQCETKNCFRAFHVTCARKAHLYMKSKLTKVGSAAEALVYRAHCHKHTPVRFFFFCICYFCTQKKSEVERLTSIAFCNSATINQ